MLELVADLGIIFMVIVLQTYKYKNHWVMEASPYSPRDQCHRVTMQCESSSVCLARFCPPDQKCMTVILLKSKRPWALGLSPQQSVIREQAPNIQNNAQ